MKEVGKGEGRKERFDCYHKTGLVVRGGWGETEPVKKSLFTFECFRNDSCQTLR